MIVSAHDVRFPQLGEREIQCVSYIDVYLITTLILHKHRPWHAFCSRLAEYKWLPIWYTAARHQRSATAKNDQVHQKRQFCEENLKIRFSILYTFYQISRTLNFWSDLDLAGDLDL